ncbi:unnamed protein product [Penicillium salamii]|uniref:FAD-binding FR-type domain-containing protein n=1 Tax=Penicillium salamii TaxID=1612424 RepID=A0A9W4JJP3_9EURO|nr:unnamed protein product [Penicillium salamii]CAG8155348.1 unnamed protein product [Penicillium salamii]CAG8222799.1 unnamed protein product [Penicillium salamii]CAG8317545.1 unnamed protein product [Penicillium salamii]CAG8329921.1 unnamed protein product [Penicillium salamii]
MDILSIYICVLATIAGLIFLQQYFNPQPSSRIRHLYNVVTRFIILPYIFRRRKFWGPITVFNLVIHSIFIAGTAVCNIFGASDVDTARQRAGSIALIHLCVLVVVPRSAFGAAFFGISIRTYNQLHRSIGVMAMFQSLLHVLLAIKMKSLDLNDIKERNGFIVSIGCYWFLLSILLFLITSTQAIVSIATVSITVIPQLRRHIYEFCIKLHLALGIFGIVMVWMHMKDKYGLNGRLLISAISLFLLNTVYFIIRELYRNVTRTTFMAVANCTPLADAVMLDFIPPRPWKVRAGYYVYLRVPQIHLLSFAETHPFNIIWWEEDKLGKATRVFVVARVQTGFTKRLSGISDQSLRLFADGPYGKPLETALWDNFLFIATDIGISAQLPYLKELIDLQRQPRRLGRVSIVWVVEDDGKFLSRPKSYQY